MNDNIFEKIDKQSQTLSEVADKLDGISVEDLYALAKRTWDHLILYRLSSPHRLLHLCPTSSVLAGQYLIQSIIGVFTVVLMPSSVRRRHPLQGKKASLIGVKS